METSTGYFAFVLNPLPPKLTWSNKLINSLSKADRSLAGLAQVGNTFPVPRMWLHVHFPSREGNMLIVVGYHAVKNQAGYLEGSAYPI